MALARWTEFFEELQHVRGRSLNTVMAYRRDLELFDEYKSSHGITIPGFYAFMKEQKLSDRSQARVISSLRTYFKFLESRGEKADELRELRPPKVKAGLPQVLSYEDYNKLLEVARSASDPLRAARNQITLVLLFGLGVRVSELVSLNLQDFSEAEAWVKVLGKGGKERVLPLTDYILQEIKVYIHQVRPHLSKDQEPTLIINDRGHRPSRVDIWRWLAAWSQKAGFESPIGPHQFRHGCATALLESGADLRSIQMLLGHSSLQTTQIYTTVSTSKLTETIQEHHPLSGIKDL